MDRLNRQLSGNFQRQILPLAAILQQQQALAQRLSSMAQPSLLAFAEQQRRMAKLVVEGPALRAFAEQQRQIQQIVRRLSAIDSETLRRISQLMERARPTNWPAGRDKEIIALIERTSWPLVWVPGTDVLTALLECETDEDLEQCLVENAQEVLTSAKARLADLPDDFHPMAARGALDCIKAFPVAPLAAQSLAATTFENILRESLGHPSLAKATKDLAAAEDWREESFLLLRWALIRSCMPNVLTPFWPTDGDPIPTQFNRHASVHALSEAQYTQTNALVGIMLVVSALRERYQIQVEGLLED